MPSCNCETPPGGSVTCPEGQIPICRVRGGASHGYCLSPRSDISGLELTAWFLSHVLGEEITAGDVMARRDLQAAMVDGRFVNQASGEITTFTIPHSIYMPIPAVAGASA